MGLSDVAWTQPDWLAGVQNWLDDTLVSLGLTAAGVPEQSHVRPWATVLRVPTRTETLYFKACGKVTSYEVALAERLARWQPGVTLDVVAVDATRGWLLTRDGGTRLRDVLSRDPDLRYWQEVLPRYAEFQLSLVDKVATCLTEAVPDRRPETLPDQFASLLQDEALLSIGEPDGLTPEVHERLHALQPNLATLCERLIDAPVPASLHHGDLHDGNIFAGAVYRFFDWDDSSVAHPFFSLRTAFVSVENTFGLEPHAPDFDVLRDGYLEP